MAEYYTKRPLWQWIVIYLLVGVLVYGLIYYFFFAKKAGYSYSTSTQQSPVAKNAVDISNFSFSPATLIINVGDTVTWTNQDSVGHSITADDGSFDTGVIGQGKTATVTFSKAGTYTYHCSVHPTMKATIVVK